MELVFKIFFFPFLLWIWLSPIVTLVYSIKKIFHSNDNELKRIAYLQIIASIYLCNYFYLYGDPKGEFFKQISVFHILMIVGIILPVLSIFVLKIFIKHSP